MDMEAAGLCKDADGSQIGKGKRTKRLRPLSPCAVAATVVTSSCSSASGDHVSGGADYGSFSSTTTTFEEGTDREEEDMANCLILLAQGGEGGDFHDLRHHHDREDGGGGNNNKTTEKGSTSSSSRRFAEMATATATKIGFFVYECKTCNRTFPSFQALGGHRASHKKPKVTAKEKKQPPPLPLPPASWPQPITNYEFSEQPHIKIGTSSAFQLGCSDNKGFHGNKTKTHECSICGSEFASGQALGGHMRRHRSSINTASATTGVEVKPRNILELDLNLPAPEEDLRDSKFQFTATQRSLVLSAAPALVGCHY